MANAALELRGSEQEGRKKTDKIRLLIVDDHPLYREGLIHFLLKEREFTVGGEAESPDDALRAVREGKPDLVITDLTLKGGNGIDFLRTVAAEFPDLRVLVLSMHDESLYAERALKAGAKGYVAKSEGTQKILEAIRTVLSGHLYMSEAMKERVLERQFKGGRDGSSSMASLSDRELEVFQMIGEGLTTAEIAQNLRLSIKTVETYRAKIKVKLNLKNNIELIQRAVHVAQWEQRGKVA